MATMNSSSILKVLKSCMAACKKYDDKAIQQSVDTGVVKALKESSGAGRFNSFYRGKDLGTTTEENITEIKARIENNFEDLYCGDTLTGVTTGITYALAHADYNFSHHYFLPPVPTHSCVIVPLCNILNNKPMNTDGTSDGGYAGSQMFTEYLPEAYDILCTDFGTTAILKYSILLVNQVTDGKPTGFSSYTRYLDLMNEVMVFGCKIFSSGVSDGQHTYSNVTTECTQLSLFRLRKDLINATNYAYGLRDISSYRGFVHVNSLPGSPSVAASSTTGIGVRPYFYL